MANRAPDIAELEQLYISGEDDTVLCAQANKIGDRIQVELALARAQMNFRLMDKLQAQTDDFTAVLRKIAGRSNTHDVLAAYKKHCKRMGRLP